MNRREKDFVRHLWWELHWLGIGLKLGQDGGPRLTGEAKLVPADLLAKLKVNRELVKQFLVLPHCRLVNAAGEVVKEWHWPEAPKEVADGCVVEWWRESWGLDGTILLRSGWER